MEIIRAIESLIAKRKIFHSEADLQFAFAWEIQLLNPSAQVRLEYSPASISPTMHIDIVIQLNDEIIPIELKYLKKKLQHQENDEQFILRDNGAQDISRYDILKDLQRIERLKQDLAGVKCGYALVLSNDPSYWKTSLNRNTIDREFRLDDGKTITGRLVWGVNAGPGTMKGREMPIDISGQYSIMWKDYSQLNDTASGIFRYLLLTV